MRSSTLAIIAFAAIFQSTYARPVGGSQSGDMLPVGASVPVGKNTDPSFVSTSDDPDLIVTTASDESFFGIPALDSITAIPVTIAGDAIAVAVAAPAH